MGVFTSVLVLVKINQEMQLRVHTAGQTDRCTDANWFYNLSHAIWYSYEADNLLAEMSDPLVRLDTIILGKIRRFGLWKVHGYTRRKKYCSSAWCNLELKLFAYLL